MDEAKLQRLREIQDMAIEHAIEEMDAVHALTLATKEERGDRAWLTGMCAKSIGVAVRIEQFISLREQRSGAWPRQTEEDEQREREAFVRRAEAQLRSIMQRQKPRFKHRAAT